jgi:hypothetical protein
MATKVPRDPNVSPEVRRFLDELARVQNLFDGVTDAAAATALLNVFTSTLKGLVPASGGGTTTFLRADGTFASAGAVLQVLQNTYATNADLNPDIPLDDTIPDITEGTEVLSQAITLASASNKVYASTKAWGAVNTVSTAIIVAMFRGSTCLNVADEVHSNINFPSSIAFDYLDSPGSVGPHTYSVRVGPSTGIARLNGSTASRQFGGATKSTLTLMEIKG